MLPVCKGYLLRSQKLRVQLWIVIIKILEEFYFVFVAQKQFGLVGISECSVKAQLPSPGRSLLL